MGPGVLRDSTRWHAYSHCQESKQTVVRCKSTAADASPSRVRLSPGRARPAPVLRGGAPACRRRERGLGPTARRDSPAPVTAGQPPSVGAEPVSPGRSSSRRRWISRRSADTRPSSSRRPLELAADSLRVASSSAQEVDAIVEPPATRPTVPAPRPRALPGQPDCRTRRPRRAWWHPRRSASARLAGHRARPSPVPGTAVARSPTTRAFARHPAGGLHISDF